MLPETLVTTPPSGGDTTDATQVAQPVVPQETQPSPQGTETPQSNGQPKVEGQAQPSSQQTARPTPASYWSERRAQRTKVQNLEREIADLKRTLDTVARKPAESVQTQPKRDYSKEIWDKPVDVIRELITEAMQESVPKILDTRFSEQETVKNRREALELIFANKRISEEGDEGVAKIVEILKSTGLDIVAQSDPKRAAQTAMEIYDLKHPKVVAPPKPSTPLAPTNKGQMATTQTGASTVTKKENTVDENRKALNELRQQIIKNPDLNYDPEFKKKVADVKAKITASVANTQQ